jgi:hypothetical protein
MEKLQSGQAIEDKVLDIDWKISVITDAKQKKEANEFVIYVKLTLVNSEGGLYHKYLEFSPVQFFEFYKEINDIKNLLDMAA